MSSTDTATNEKVFKHPLGTITLLNDTNYASWKADCEQVLHEIKAWRVVMGEEGEPENPEGITKAAIHGRRAYEDYTTRRARAGAIIYGSCSPEVKTHLNQVRDPARMWEILTEEMDTANTTVGRLTLFRQFSLLRPVPGQPISAYFSQLLNITNQLAGTPEAVPDMVLKNHIFTTLPEMFKISIKVLQSRPDVTIRQIMSDLKKCEQNEALAKARCCLRSFVLSARRKRWWPRSRRTWKQSRRKRTWRPPEVVHLVQLQQPQLRQLLEERQYVRIRWRPEMRRRPDMTESPSTGSGGGSLPSFVLTAFLYIERSCARIIL